MAGESRFYQWFNRRGWSDVVIVAPYVWLLVFFLVPFLIVLAMSFATRTPTAPPFGYGGDNPLLNTAGYARLISDALYIRAFVTSLVNAAVAMFLCLAVGYPMALGLIKIEPGWRNILLMLVILPFWTSFLLRVYAWMGLMGSNSWFNNLLTEGWNWVVPQDWALHAIPMMHTNFAVVLVMVYTYLPFMVLPLYARLSRLDPSLIEAAADLGAPPLIAFARVTVPLSLPGAAAGSALVFIPAIGEYVIPALLGGPQAQLIGKVLWEEFFANRDWPTASAVAVWLLVVLIVVPWLAFQAVNRARALAPSSRRAYPRPFDGS